MGVRQVNATLPTRLGGKAGASSSAKVKSSSSGQSAEDKTLNSSCTITIEILSCFRQLLTNCQRSDRKLSLFSAKPETTVTGYVDLQRRFGHAIAEGTAEWSATGPENQSVVMSDGRSIRLPSANFAQVREPGRNGPAVTRFPRVGRGGSNPPLCTMCQRARIGIAACLRNRCLRVRISPLAPTSFCGYDAVWENYSLGSTGSLSKARTPKTHS